MTEQEVEDLFYSAAVTEAVALGYRLGDGADNDIRVRAQGAARTVFREPRTDAERDLDIEHGVRAFRMVVDTMIGLRREAYRNQPAMLQGKIIGEETLRLAIEKLCPGLFPFC